MPKKKTTIDQNYRFDDLEDIMDDQSEVDEILEDNDNENNIDVDNDPLNAGADDWKPDYSEIRYIEVGTIEDVFGANRLGNSFLGSMDFESGFVLDSDGRMINDEDTLVRHLSDPDNRYKNFYAFRGSDGERPYAIQNTGEKIRVSSEPVGTDNLRDHKKSLKITDIIKASNFESVAKWNKDKREVLVNRIMKSEASQKAYIAQFEKKEEKFKESGYEETRRRLAILNKSDEDTFGKIPEKPVKPKESIGTKIWNGIVGLFTAFRKTSKGHKEYLQKLEQFNKKDAEYREKKELAEKQKKIVDRNYQKKLDVYSQNVVNARELVKNGKEIISRLKKEEEYAKTTGRRYDLECRKQLEEYHSQIEVRLEGVADLNQKGMITADNIFANNWLLAGSLKGRKALVYTDEDRENLAKYVASRMIEKKIVNSAIGNKNYYENECSSDIAALNNGSAVLAVYKSKLFYDTLDATLDNLKDQPDAELDLESFVDNFERNLSYERSQRHDPLKILGEEKERLYNEFGQKTEIKPEDLLTVARYKALNDEIRKVTKYKEEHGGEYKRDAFDEARRFVGDLHVSSNKYIGRKNGELVEKNVKVEADVFSVYMQGNYKAAFDKVMENQKNAREQYENAIKSVHKDIGEGSKMILEDLSHVSADKMGINTGADSNKNVYLGGDKNKLADRDEETTRNYVRQGHLANNVRKFNLDEVVGFVDSAYEQLNAKKSMGAMVK